MKPNLRPSAKSADNSVPERAAAMSDGIIAAMLSGFHTDAATIKQTRNAFVSFCQAHPDLRDVRQAWAQFHAKLMIEVSGQKSAKEAAPAAAAPAAIIWPEFIHRYWTPATPTAFTDERLKLANTDRRAVINLITTARRMGVPEDFILDRSKYTATDLALRDIRHATLKTSAQ